MKKLSIIIPAYNAEKTVDHVVYKILKQADETFEIIIVNDGSTDDTAKVLAKYQKDPRIIIIDQENAGASAARNTGIGRAQGKYLMFIDADDDFSPHLFSIMTNAISTKEADIVICGHGGDGVRSVLPDRDGLVKRNLPKHICSSILKNGLLYPTWNKIYRTKIIKEKNIRFRKEIGFGEDLIFNLNYFKYIDAIYYIKRPLYEYIYRSSGLSAKTAANLNYRYEMLAALRDYLGSDIKKPGIALKYQLIRMRWILSTKKAKLKQGKGNDKY